MSARTITDSTTRTLVELTHVLTSIREGLDADLPLQSDTPSRSGLLGQMEDNHDRANECLGLALSISTLLHDAEDVKGTGFIPAPSTASVRY